MWCSGNAVRCFRRRRCPATPAATRARAACLLQRRSIAWGQRPQWAAPAAACSRSTLAGTGASVAGRVCGPWRVPRRCAARDDPSSARGASGAARPRRASSDPPMRDGHAQPAALGVARPRGGVRHGLLPQTPDCLWVPNKHHGNGLYTSAVPPWRRRRPQAAAGAAGACDGPAQARHRARRAGTSACAPAAQLGARLQRSLTSAGCHTTKQ